MSAPHPRFPDNTPSLKRVLAAFAPPEEQHAERAIRELNGVPCPWPRDLDKPTENDRPQSAEKQSSEVADAPGADRLAEIATLVRLLTFGEMVELAAEIWKAADGKEITAETLADILWTWSSK